MAGCLKVDNFLFCFSLRSGILFVACADIVSHIYALLTWAFFADTTMFYLHRVPFAKPLAIVLLVFAILTLLAQVLLVIGVVYRHSVLLLIWMILCGIYLACVVALMLACTILVALAFPMLPSWAAGTFFIFFFIACWTFYIFCVVYTYYKMMDNEMKSIYPSNGNYPIGQLKDGRFSPFGVRTQLE